MRMHTARGQASLLGTPGCQQAERRGHTSSSSSRLGRAASTAPSCSRRTSPPLNVRTWDHDILSKLQGATLRHSATQVPAALEEDPTEGAHISQEFKASCACYVPSMTCEQGAVLYAGLTSCCCLGRGKPRRSSRRSGVSAPSSTGPSDASSVISLHAHPHDC